MEYYYFVFLEKMNKAVFLDRDGVINEERGEYTWKKEDFILLPGVAEALKKLKTKGFLLIVITNQGGIARGLYSLHDFYTVNKFMLTELETAGAKPDDWFFCPHYHETGQCLCRKPESLLLERAAGKHAIDLTSSWFIGDRDRDIEAGKKAGVKTIKVESNSSLLSILDQIS